jgi:hypothetical protein
MDVHNIKDKERKHKSKKRERHGDANDKRKHKKRKEKEAVVRVVDDDLDGEDMWVEKNIDTVGEKVRKALVYMVLSHPHFLASCNRYTYRGESKADFQCSPQV